VNSNTACAFRDPSLARDDVLFTTYTSLLSQSANSLSFTHFQLPHHYTHTHTLTHKTPTNKMARDKRPPTKPFSSEVDKQHADAVSYSRPLTINTQAWMQQTASNYIPSWTAYKGKIASRQVPRVDTPVTRRAKVLRQERRWNRIDAELKAMKGEADPVSTKEWWRRSYVR
jgi:hypothetical protein